jgi:hypothetical protein
MLDISIKDLHRKQIEKKNIEYEHFNKILKQCCEHIKIVSNRSDDTSCFFQLPTFVFGIPLYDFEKCSRFIIYNLKKEGLMVTYFVPNTLYISWDIQYTSKNVPPPQLMPPMQQQNRQQQYAQPRFNNMHPNSTIPKIPDKPQQNYNTINDYKPSGNFLGNNSY